jgi:hypothetical protein
MLEAVGVQRSLRPVLTERSEGRFIVRCDRYLHQADGQAHSPLAVWRLIHHGGSGSLLAAGTPPLGGVSLLNTARCQQIGHCVRPARCWGIGGGRVALRLVQARRREAGHLSHATPFWHDLCCRAVGDVRAIHHTAQRGRACPP